MIERRPAAEELRPMQGAQIPSPTGTYEVLGLLGAGGNARVYLAQRHGWDESASEPRLCTLKVATSEPEAERLVAEGSLLASLQHPGVPQPIELFDWQSATCLATEHRAGRTLEQLQQEEGGGPLSPREVLTWAAKVCDILSYLHSQPAPVVHRDVKPQNLLLTDNGDIVLLDFGASRLYDARKPGDTVALGSPEYAAPEQLQGGSQSGPQADLWGLGATCFRLLTGGGPDRLFTFPPLHEVLPGVPVELEAALGRALQYEPARRFADASAMKAAFEQALAALPAPGERHESPYSVDHLTAAAATAAIPLPAARPADRGRPADPGRLVDAAKPLRRVRVRQPGGPGHAAATTPPPHTAPPLTAAPLAPAPEPAGAQRAAAGDRLVLLVSTLSPLVSAMIVGATLYLALTAHSPLSLTQQPLATPTAVGSGGVVETGLGSLVLATEPAGASAELDGKPLQNLTPMRLTRLTAGTHRLRLTLPGYSPAERTLDVRAGTEDELNVSLSALVQLTLGFVPEGEASGAWRELIPKPISPEAAERLAVKVTPAVQGSLREGQATLQVVLRPGDGTSRSLYSGTYAWGQVRPLWPGRLNPGSYTLEATVIGVDLPPVQAAASFQVTE